MTEPQSDFVTADRMVGGYELVREVGRGGMAVVYLARQTALGRQVALKELAGLTNGDAKLAERFVLEAHVAGGLAHPNIVTVHDLFEDAEVPYIAMEYLPKGSLRPYVGRLTLPQITGVVEGVLAGLDHAEAHEVVHRDLKPENLLVTPGGSVKIADFGIAKALSRVTTGLTARGQTMGTPAYMAPEQALGRTVGPATDLYATGVLVYELLTGRPPFEPGGEPLGLLMRHINEPVPDPRALAPDLDPALSDWLLRMLAKSPEDRPAGAQAAWLEFEDAIVRLLGSFWRREARLPDASDGDTPDRPLSEARFTSIATPTPHEVPEYRTYVDPLQPRRAAEEARGETARAEQARAEEARAEEARAEQARAEQARAEEARAEQARAEQARAEQARAEQARADESRPEESPRTTRPPRLPPEPPETAAPPRRRRRRGVLAGTIVLLIAGGAATAITVLPGDPAPERYDTRQVETLIRERLSVQSRVVSVRCPAVSADTTNFVCEATLAPDQLMQVGVERTSRGIRIQPHL